MDIFRIQRLFLLLFASCFAFLFIAGVLPEHPAQPSSIDGQLSAVYHRHQYPGDEDQDSTLKPFNRVEAHKVCQPCHEVSAEGYVKDSTNILNHRLESSREKWVEQIDLTGKCGMCHTLVDPATVPQNRWPDVLEHMLYITKVRFWPMDISSADWLDVLHYYVTGSKNFDEIPPDPPISGIPFTVREIGRKPPEVETPKIANVNIVDLDRNGVADILVADIDQGGIMWEYQTDTGWVERKLAPARAPAKTEVFDFNKDGKMDIVVAYLGNMLPTDELVGGALLLLNDGFTNFRVKPLLTNMGRLADVRPADFDNDGDIDFIVATFGFLTVGEIGWLEQLPNPSKQIDSISFSYHKLSPKAGGIHVIPTDLNGDGLMDVVALIAQEHEEVLAFINQGKGEFKQQLLYKAFSPAFGSSGIELVDLDRDGDQDVLYTNGDAVDLPTPMVLPYHGVQWLENKGNLEFEYHSIFSFYGAYRAVPGDLDNDGDTDIVVVSMLSHWEDSTRMSTIWLENDGAQHFTPRGIGRTPINLITLDVGDLDGDGDLDLVTGGMNVFTIIEERIGRVTMWRNDGTFAKKSQKKKEKKKK